MTDNKISLIELLKIFAEYRQNIIVNIKHLQETYQRTSIKRIKGIRDHNAQLIQPWLQTEYIDNAEYVGMGEFEFNRNTATINMLVKRQAKLTKIEDKTPILEVAGLLANDLEAFNNYTIVSDGKINVQSLKVKVSSKKAFDYLKTKGMLNTGEFDFHNEYTIQLDNLPLVPFNQHYSNIDGLFEQLAEIKVLSSIVSAHLKEESDVFVPEQLQDLKKHYLSKNTYINFPTTNEYNDIRQALANGTIDSRVSYKIDIGSKDILSFSKLPSANKFLDRMYRTYNKETGKIFPKANLRMLFNPHIAFRHKLLSSRTKITKVDELMKPIFDDFLGLENNGIVAGIIAKVGTNSLAEILQQKQAGKQISKEEMIAALTATNTQLKQYTEKIYQDQIAPLVFYIGVTGHLPDKMTVPAMTAEELASQYPNLQFSKDELEGKFFVVGNSIISIYTKTEYYSKKVAIVVN